MKRVMQVTMPILMAILVNLLTLGVHSTAMAATNSGHSSGMNHTSTTNVSCLSICTASTPQKLKVLDVQQQKDDDDYTPPFYESVQSISQAFEEKHDSLTKVATAFRPPPGPPIYVLDSIFRF